VTSASGPGSMRFPLGTDTSRRGDHRFLECRARQPVSATLKAEMPSAKTPVPMGPVVVTGGQHKGRIGDYDDDDVDERDRPAAVVYFGDMFQLAPEVIAYSKLRELTPDDLSRRRTELEEILFPIQDRADPALSREAALAELLLVERLMHAQIVATAPTDPSADDLTFMRLATQESRESVQESGRADPSPRVGVVIVKEGKIIAQAHRNERGEHGEYVALQKHLGGRGEAVGSTVYTTLEPCSSRGRGKTPCAEWLIQNGVAKVWVGTLDPDPRIQGHGVRNLQAARIEVQMFPIALNREIEALNADFIQHRKRLAKEREA
jgi:pyrimidine deaminase RibD-like protein